MKFTRDGWIWTVGFLAGVIAFVVGSTQLVPAEYADTVKDIGAVLGFISGKLGFSPIAASSTAERHDRT